MAVEVPSTIATRLPADAIAGERRNRGPPAWGRCCDGYVTATTSKLVELVEMHPGASVLGRGRRTSSRGRPRPPCGHQSQTCIAFSAAAGMIASAVTQLWTTSTRSTSCSSLSSASAVARSGQSDLIFRSVSSMRPRRAVPSRMLSSDGRTCRPRSSRTLGMHSGGIAGRVFSVDRGGARSAGRCA